MEGTPTAKKLKLDSDQVEVPGEPAIVGDMAGKLLGVENSMCQALDKLEFLSPVTHIYNPLDYAAIPHTNYVSRYGNGTKKILFVGMNPGPYGMAQNGVAFGDTAMVRDWLQISGHVDKPSPEHPNRLIRGLACDKAEVSGTRFWGLWRDLCQSPHTFFKNSFVHNYCPFCFMSKSGKNITPPSLRGEAKRQLQDICDSALLEVIRLLEVEWVVGVGKYGADRAKAILKSEYISSLPPTASGEGKKGRQSSKRHQNGVETFKLPPPGSHGDGDVVYREVQVCSILHPSPINPAANKGWVDVVKTQLEEYELLSLIQDIED